MDFVGILIFSLIFCSIFGEEKTKPKKKKDLQDYNDADLERLFEEWEKDEDPLEPDELPEHLRPMPKIDMSKVDFQNPESLLEATKKGRTLMTFVSVSGNPSKRELEEITQLWQSSLHNAHIDVQRYVIDENRAIFMFKEGSQAWKGKEFLIAQDRCADVTIEGKVYPGKGATEGAKEGATEGAKESAKEGAGKGAKEGAKADGRQGAGQGAKEGAAAEKPKKSKKEDL